jgi:uncharacterized phage protein (predicted DNA packaging)
MSSVTLSLAKAHMKLDGNSDDELIQLYLGASESYCGHFIGRPLNTINPLPDDLKLAVLKLTAFHYEMRSLATFGLTAQVAPGGVTALLENYRKDWFGRADEGSADA